MLTDTSVVRNFAVLGWTDELLHLSGEAIRLAEGVIGATEDEPGELEAAKVFWDQQATGARLGSREQAAAIEAAEGLASLLARRSSHVEVMTPTAEEAALALRLQDRDERAWRQSLGVRARRLDLGEAVSVAIAASRSLAFASDDADGARAYQALGGSDHYWTLDLIRRAVAEGSVTEAQGRAGYERLIRDYDFFGTPWDAQMP
jgi:hypothetical protein